MTTEEIVAVAELENNLISVCGQIMRLAMRIAEVRNSDNPERMGEFESLYQQRRLNLLLSIAAEHGLAGVAGVRLAMVAPETGKPMVQLFELHAEPVTGAPH